MTQLLLSEPFLDQIQTEMQARFKIALSIFEGNFVLQNILKMRSYIAGGAIRSSILDEKINDVDVFLFNREALEHLSTELIDDEGNLKVKIGTGWLFKRTINSYTFEHEKNIFPKVQIIHKHTNMPSLMIRQFDLRCNMNYYIPSSDYLHVEALDEILGKRLHVNINNCAVVNTFYRFHKFAAKGWKYDEKELASLVILLSKLYPIESRDEVQDQLLMGMSEVEF